jgi:hypothetical protein
LAENQRTSTLSHSRQDLDGHKLIAMELLIIFAVLILAGIASAAGWTPDTRDPDYSVGRMLASGRGPDT